MDIKKAAKQGNKQVVLHMVMCFLKVLGHLNIINFPLFQMENELFSGVQKCG